MGVKIKTNIENSAIVGANSKIDASNINNLVEYKEVLYGDDGAYDLTGDLVVLQCRYHQMTEYTMVPNHDKRLEKSYQDLAKLSIETLMGVYGTIFSFGESFYNIYQSQNPYRPDNIYFFPNIVKVFLFEEVLSRQFRFYFAPPYPPNEGFLILQDEARTARADLQHIKCDNFGRVNPPVEILHKITFYADYYHDTNNILTTCHNRLKNMWPFAPMSTPTNSSILTRSVNTIEKIKGLIRSESGKILENNSLQNDPNNYTFRKFIRQYDKGIYAEINSI